MTRDDDFFGPLEGYLDEYEGSTPLPEDVRNAIRAQLPSSKQRPAWWPGWRFPEMNQAMRIALASAAVLAVAVIGISLFRGMIGGPDLIGSSHLQAQNRRFYPTARWRPAPIRWPRSRCRGDQSASR